jgi:hypothetical protein
MRAGCPQEVQIKKNKQSAPAAGLRPHKVLELLLHLAALRASFNNTVAITHKQHPYAKTYRVQQEWGLRSQRRHKTGAGNKGAKQEEYRRFHDINILNILAISAN